MTPRRHEDRDRGATAVEYGLLVAGVVAAFVLAAVGLQHAVGAVVNQQATNISNDK